MKRPELGLDWEEGVFRALLGVWRRLSPARGETAPGEVRLDELRARLTPLAQLVAEEPVRILPARRAGGVRGRDLLLPESIAIAPDVEGNRGVYRVRTVISAEVRRRTRGRAPGAQGPLAPLESLRVAREAADSLAERLPRFQEAYDEARAHVLASRPDPARLRGRARVLERIGQEALRGGRPWEDEAQVRALAAAAARGTADEALVLFGAWLPSLDAPDARAPDGEAKAPEDVESEEAAPAVEALRRVRLDPREREDAVLIHTFEKVETLDSYQGGARDTDGADELDAHGEALREVELGDLVRTDDPSHSVLRADLALGLEVPDVESSGETGGIAYDEWDFRRRRYRPEWCRVHPRRVEATDVAWAGEAGARQRRLIRALRRKLEIHRAGREERGRQLDGEDVDVEALIDEQAAARAGRDADGRVYVRAEKRRRDFATTVLLDVSLSTDAWIDGRRVLDVARDSVFVLGEVASQLGDRLQILAFASHTRNDCGVWQVKDWSDPWEVARSRLGALEPRGYTRIGPALRYATDRLAAEPAERRLLLLISDGKPTDYDRYEGRYGMADVRQALREAERREVSAHALAVDAVARDYLPPMFGPGAWHVLPHPDRLPSLLSTVYGRLTSR